MGRGGFGFALALITLLFALCAQGGPKVVNDYRDVETNALNHERWHPFTGGSRFIQNGGRSSRATGWLDYLSLALVMPAGMWPVCRRGMVLIVIGRLGLLAIGRRLTPPLFSKLAFRAPAFAWHRLRGNGGQPA